MAGMLLFYRHGAYPYYRYYEPQGKPMPTAVAMGMCPMCDFVSTMRMPAFVDEVDIAGGLRQEPVELVKCETNDLYVPATSEMVIEATIMPHERVEEGPFGEYTGYRVSERTGRERVLYRVDAITFRNDPIHPFSNMGMPMDESDITASISQSAFITDELRSKGFPIRGAALLPWSCSGAIIISTKVPYGPYIHELTSAVWGSVLGRDLYNIIVVEDSVDPFNLEQVHHEMVMRCHPKRSIKVVEGGPASPLTPYLSAHERFYGMGTGIVYDCTAPPDWPFPPIEVKFTNPLMYPPEIQEKVLRRWTEYGYKSKA
jgi:4-hydroxy-3-polyprenylbenzoate decarboxylase